MLDLWNAVVIVGQVRTKVVGVAAGPQATAMMRRSSISSLACRSSPAPTICA